LLFLSDETIQKTVDKNQTQTMSDIVEYGKYYGDWLLPLGFSAGLYLSGLAIENREVKETGSILIESLLASGITVTLLKVILGRSRPYNNEGQYSFHYFEFKNIFNSLPSGHAAVAFTTSTVLAERINNIYASLGLYGLATLTAYQRIYSGNHWFSDTFLGAIIGIVIGKYFVNLYGSNTHTRQSKINYKLLPYISNNYAGLGIGIKF